MEDMRQRRYVRLNMTTDEAYQDELFTPFEAEHINAKLAADGSEYRWVAYGTREGDAVAA